MHVHVQSADGEVKIWIEPAIEVAAVHGMTEQEVTRVLGMVRRREGEIRRAWDDHFAG